MAKGAAEGLGRVDALLVHHHMVGIAAPRLDASHVRLVAVVGEGGAVLAVLLVAFRA